MFVKKFLPTTVPTHRKAALIPAAPVYHTVDRIRRLKIGPSGQKPPPTAPTAPTAPTVPTILLLLLFYSAAPAPLVPPLPESLNGPGSLPSSPVYDAWLILLDHGITHHRS